MPGPAFTLDDFQFLGKYDPSVNYGQIPESDKARFTSIRNRVKELIDAATNDSDVAWKTVVSILNPSGRTAKDYWCAVYPPGADNKSFAPQIAAIVLARGIEFCFCLGAGEGSFANSDDRLRNQRYFDAARERLRTLPDPLRDQLRALPESWRFRTRWRLPDAVGEFDTADAWLDFAGSAEGAGASISKYLSVQEAIERGQSLSDDFIAVIALFSSVLLHLDGAPLGQLNEVPRRQPTLEPHSPRVWLVAAGEGARLWDRFRNDGEVAIGMSPLGDLRDYPTRDAAAEALRGAREDDVEPVNDALACFEFVHVMRPDDIVYAKRGLDQVLGVGIVASDYIYDPNRPEYKNIRKVRWTSVGEWQLPHDVRLPVKTLTEITRYETLRRTLEDLTSSHQDEAASDAPAPSEEPPFTIDDGLIDTFIAREEWVRILRAWSRKKNLILQGSPGVGKTFLARRLAYSLLGRKSPKRVRILQFHQSYSYEEFVEGFRPASGGGLKLTDGFFKQFCAVARKEHDNSYVLIIDEINRGNVSRIFGELLSLVEADKRGPEHGVQLAYSGPTSPPFHVPQNVYILGLMNTADRSLAFVDYALRRRFAFRTVSPAFGRAQFSDYLQAQGAPSDTVAKIVDRLTKLNALIASDERNLGPGYQIGHSYFCVQRTEEALGESWYRDVIENEVIPLIEEYWAGIPGKLAEAKALLFS
jgi:MoxR-like ATPase